MLLILTLGLCGTSGAEASVNGLTLPENSSDLSYELALQALELCTGHTKDKTAALFRKYGFSIVMQKNFDKADYDPSHTCAYTIGSREIEYNGETRTLLAVAIRGTNAAEWYSNFDIAPSRSASPLFAENFMLAAQDVFNGLEEVLANVENPLVLICGHSRGAACANLLSTLVNAACDPSQVFIYTFATPTTVRGAFEANNVFNFINPCDVVPYLPLASWGFNRIGKDIVLPGDEATIKELETAISMLSGLAGSITDYYETRHSLTGPGESENGSTVFEFLTGMTMSLTTQTMPGSINSQANLESAALLSPESDFAPLLAYLAQFSSQNRPEILIRHLGPTYEQLIRSIMAD